MYLLSITKLSDIVSRQKKYILFILLFISLRTSGFTSVNSNTSHVGFLLIYDTNKPMTFYKSVLFYSRQKWLIQKQDSIVLQFKQGLPAPDSLVFDTAFNSPVYLRLKLYTKDRILLSNEFHYTTGSIFFDAFVENNQLKVNPTLSGDNISTPNSLQGLVLVIQAILEMIIALLISRTFGMSRIIILMVLTANIAAFPLYLFKIPYIITLELIVFVTKTLVMILVGMKKIPIPKIILLSVILTAITFGIKEIFLLLIKFI